MFVCALASADDMVLLLRRLAHAMRLILQSTLTMMCYLMLILMACLEIAI